MICANITTRFLVVFYTHPEGGIDMKISSNVKKLTTAALAGAMLFSQSAFPSDVATSANAEESYYYYDTFEDSSDNWEVRGAGE